MRGLLQSKKARYLAIFLAVVCFTISVCSIFFLYFTVSLGMYEKNWNKIKSESYERVQNLYSMKIFEERESNPGCLNDTNLEYGIIKQDSVKAKNYEDLANYVDYNDMSIYEYQNFKTYTPDANSFVREFKESETAVCHLTLFRSLLNEGYTYDVSETFDKEIEGVCYNSEDGVFYYILENAYAPIQSIALGEDNSYSLNDEGKYVNEASKEIKALDTKLYTNWKNIEFDGIYPCAAEQIETIDMRSFQEERKLDANYSIYLDDDPGEESGEYLASLRISGEIQEEDIAVYWVVSSVKTPLDMSKNDLFVQQQKFLRVLYQIRYLLIAMGVVFTILGIVAVIFCCRNIALEAKEGKENRKLYYRMPPLVFYLIMGVLCVLDVEAGVGGIYILSHETFEGVPWVLAGLFCLAAVGILLGIWMLLNLVYRCKAKILWKQTLLCYVVKKLKGMSELFRQNTSLVLRGGLALAVLTLLELFVIVQTDYRTDLEIFAFFIYKVIEVVFVLLVLLQMKKLQDGSRRMAQGDLETKIDTRNLNWEFKKHGEYLNQIHDGISIALQERMKSEHFKTELITNVSHDIKTPLTSIINYVDLIKREEIDNPTVQEYLDVLEHHSVRLKKLTEDLLEASKASTGNLTVNWEDCDVNILLTQVLGEFEERLETAGLELITKEQESSVCISADNRHLWRIFDNLMSNICKYAQPGTRVYIDENVYQDSVNIVFRNTSKYPLNITSEELLERFVRGDTSRNTEGSGLGLSIAQNLAELMNGKLELYVDGDLFKVILIFQKKK